MNIRIIATLLLCFSLCMAWGQGNITRNKPKETTQKKTSSSTSKKTSSSTPKKTTPKVQPKKTSSVPDPVLGTSSYTPEVKTFTVNGVTFEMVEVRGGTFRMGSTSEQGSDAESDEKPVHSVTVSNYYIGKTEVTQELWQAVMGSNPSYYKGNKRPVENVSWDDCKKFISKLNTLTGQWFSLPTEAEWEFACRGGIKSNGYKYSGSNNIDIVAWYTDNSDHATHEVGKLKPNELGIYDMSGNVWEWCSDWYGNYSSNAQTNPTGPTSGYGRVDRGGCWSSDARYCRSSNRGRITPDFRYYNLGLRLCLSE